MRRTIQGLLLPSEQIVNRARARIVLTVVRRDSSSYTVTIDSKDSIQGQPPIPTPRDYKIADRAMRDFLSVKKRAPKRAVSSTGKRKR